jgi:periplasmic protein TonB
MFTSEEISGRRHGGRSGRRGWILGSSLALHALALATLLAFQGWRVEAVAEPPLNDVFQVALPPPLPATRDADRQPAAGGPIKKAPASPATPAARQPALPDPTVQPLPTQPPEAPADLQPHDAVPAPADDRGADRSGAERGFGERSADGGGGDDGQGVGEGEGGGDRPLPVGGAISRPQIIPGTRVEPVYTEAARQARLQGAVVLQATIDEAGMVIDLRVLRPLALGLDREALRAVGRWRFTPALLHGRPVKAFFTVTVLFEVR